MPEDQEDDDILYEHLRFRTAGAKENPKNEAADSQEKNDAASIDKVYLEKALLEDSLDQKRVNQEINDN